MEESQLFAILVCLLYTWIDGVEDGNYCISCGQDRSLCLCDPERDDMKDGFLTKRYKGHQSYCVNDVSMSILIYWFIL